MISLCTDSYGVTSSPSCHFDSLKITVIFLEHIPCFQTPQTISGSTGRKTETSNSPVSDPQLIAAALRRVLKLFNIYKNEKNIIHWEMCVKVLPAHDLARGDNQIKTGAFPVYKVTLPFQAK